MKYWINCLNNIVNVYVSASVCFYRLRNNFERKIRKINFWHQNVIQKSRRYSTRIGGFGEKKNRDLGNILSQSHYSKSQIFAQKFNFDKTPTFSRVFHWKFFWQFFLWNQSCQQLKSPKPQHFHEFFAQFFFDNFSREIKVVNS